MPNARANGIQSEYDTFGNPSSPPLLLIMGLGGQLIHWDENFCRQLAEKGLCVIEGMGHDLPHTKGPWPQVIEAIVAHIKKADHLGN